MSIKDALLKAGFQSTKIQNERKSIPKHLKKNIEKHQEHRNFCEVCELIQPDVERFKHRMPHIDAEWICLNCADKEQVPDQFRVTAQSDASRLKQYRRFYGATKDFSAEPGQRSKHQPISKKPTARVQVKAHNYDVVDEDDVDDFGEKNFNR